jgi:regulatory protein
MVRFTDDGGDETVAPVIPLFGGSRPEAQPSRSVAPAARRMPRFEETQHEQPAQSDVEEVDPEQRLKTATDRLLRKLGSRGLSVSVATDVLLSDGVPRDEASTVIADLEARGWLSDEMLAEQLVHAALTRNKDGRRGIAQKLAKRRIARDAADAVLAEVPDDDAERALEFARTKARSMRSLDRDTALRRLTGQLARRGYPGSVSLTAARTALDEVGSSANAVRFR